MGIMHLCKLTEEKKFICTNDQIIISYFNSKYFKNEFLNTKFSSSFLFATQSSCNWLSCYSVSMSRKGGGNMS